MYPKNQILVLPKALSKKIDGFDQCDAHAQILQVDHDLDTEEMPLYVLKDVVNPRSKPRKSFVLFHPFRALAICKTFNRCY